MPEGAKDFRGGWECSGIRRDPLRVQFAVAVRYEDSYTIEAGGAEGLASEKCALRMSCGVGRGDLKRRDSRASDLRTWDNAGRRSMDRRS